MTLLLETRFQRADGAETCMVANHEITKSLEPAYLAIIQMNVLFLKQIELI